MVSDITMEKIAGLHKAIANRLVPHALGCICAACTLADLARMLLTRARIAERERDEARAFLAESDKDREHIRAENEALGARVHSDICGKACVAECGGKYAR